MTSRKSSGSILAESAVEPTRSASDPRGIKSISAPRRVSAAARPDRRRLLNELTNLISHHHFTFFFFFRAFRSSTQYFAQAFNSCRSSRRLLNCPRRGFSFLVSILHLPRLLQSRPCSLYHLGGNPHPQSMPRWTVGHWTPSSAVMSSLVVVLCVSVK